MEPVLETELNGSDSDSEDVAFANMDFGGVNFDVDGDEEDILSPEAKAALSIEERVLFQESPRQEENERASQLLQLESDLSTGKYLQALKEFPSIPGPSTPTPECENSPSISDVVRQCVVEYTQGDNSVEKCIELELQAVSALNLFLQLNYTGPTLEQIAQQQDGTHETGVQDPVQQLWQGSKSSFHVYLFQLLQERSSTQNEATDRSKSASSNQQGNEGVQNAILSELAVDGEWPCPVCHGVYFLWLARCVLHALALPGLPNWQTSRSGEKNASSGATSIPPREVQACPPYFDSTVSQLKCVSLWNARAAVAHERLLQSKYPTVTLWEEVKQSFLVALETFCLPIDDDQTKVATTKERLRAAAVVLEWGLAQHHLDRPGNGKLMFHKAKHYSGLHMRVTGAMGKRTKYQQSSTAQMLVQAESTMEEKKDSSELVVPHRSEHTADELLLERIKFENNENDIRPLTILDQAIILAFCLDVKNSNPADGLTSEEMGAYLARVLDHHDDWMVYSTALLERSWLDFESSHGRERALLQLQALLDQHTSRLTLTQSTFESVESSAPPQERLSHLHSIVYPPRWVLQRDVADRYAQLGILTSAAELFQEIELWDEVVECYRRAGKQHKAEKIVRERLEREQPTPRMWAALGDITGDPQYYHNALALSHGRYSHAYVALGHHHFDKKELHKAAGFYRAAVKIRPLLPRVWFRLGTVSMQLEDWETALSAFSEVVQQEPEEADAWANVAAIHMHNKNPSEAYPALNEVRPHFLNHPLGPWLCSHIGFCALSLYDMDETIGECG